MSDNGYSLLDKSSLSVSSEIVKSYVDNQTKILATRVSTNETDISALNTSLLGLKTTVEGIPTSVKWQNTSILSTTANQITATTSNSAFIGYNVAQGMTANADRVSMIGPYAGAQTTISTKCSSVIGYNAGRNVEGGIEFSEVIGTNAGYGWNGKIYNTILIGCNTMNVNTRRSDTAKKCEFNVFVGCEILWNLPIDMENTVAIGNVAYPTGSNQVTLGNSKTNMYLYAPPQLRSDVRDMNEVLTLSTAEGSAYDPVAFIKQILPKTFIWDYRDDYLTETSRYVDQQVPDGTNKRDRIHNGFDAAQIKAVADAMGFDFGGYQDHTINGGMDVKTLAVDELIPPMVACIQSLLARVESLEAALKAHEYK